MQSITIKCALFIDDDKVTNFINQFLAQRSNHFENVMVASSAQEGLDYIQKANNGETVPPEIIFLDINMPAMNGWDFLNTLNQMSIPLKEKLNIYMLSSSSRKTDVNKAKEYSNVKGFVTKPLTKDTLKKLITNESVFKFN